MHIVVVTGMSGAGRSTAVHVLEDLGYYCVDNLPPSLAPDLVALAAREGEIDKVGLGVDVRNGAFLEGADQALAALRKAGHSVEVLFLDAEDNIIARRYSETRRPHPLAAAGDLLGGIQRERVHLAPLRAEAARVIDTTRLSVHDLKRTLLDHLTGHGAKRDMVVRIISFGFKYGLPVDADLVFDLRYLPNPHFIEDLRPKTGLDSDVSTYVLDRPEAEELLTDLSQFFKHTLPRYEREGKAYLTIAIGCTGGRHRSVAVTEELGKRLGGGRELNIHHRDIKRKKPR